MKKLILLFSIIFLLNGCFFHNDTIIKTSHIKTKCPKFPIQEYDKIKSHEIKGIKIKNINGVKYVQMKKETFLSFITEYKKIKEKYNNLRNNIIKFQK